MELSLSRGWTVLQDVHDLGEELALYRRDWEATAVAAGFSEWEPIDRLAHLQLLFAENPYFGRSLRAFNEHAWWYRLQFLLPGEWNSPYATLRMEGVDYFCRVWLNDQCLGEHEGYSAPFEFEVGHLLEKERPNVLVAQVRSPWDKHVLPGQAGSRIFAVVRDMVKGTYEHADTFVQRDVNPVGIWAAVKLRGHAGVRFIERPAVAVQLAPDHQQAKLQVSCSLGASDGPRGVVLRCHISEEDSGRRVAYQEQALTLAPGVTSVALELPLAAPRLWATWDRGEQSLYRAAIEIASENGTPQTVEERFGVRTVALRRSATETTFLLNDERLFLRGTTYFPDAYVSAMSVERYRRDLQAVRRAGCNAVRIHVHSENPAFYDLCDELGIAVIQDSDLNWVHPTDEIWKDRAVRIFADMIRALRNHPSILAWICMNEPYGYAQGTMLTTCPGPQLAAEAQRLDPDRPTIRGSGAWDDLQSGDSHNYKGSLNGAQTHYTDIYGENEKLNTEFGFDAPPSVASLRQVPAIYQRLQGIVDSIGSLQHYQYRLLKYFIEHYRIGKYAPCSGYFQFMFIDLCPQSFYGVYDWWGLPKEGLRALEESNQPLGVFMEYKDSPVAIWAVNDLRQELVGSVVHWTVADDAGAVIACGERSVNVPADSCLRVADLDLAVQADRGYRVALRWCAASGQLLAGNVYNDPFRHPPHPLGHPQRMSHEIGMRLYEA
jgi:beta-mannosidase